MGAAQWQVPEFIKALLGKGLSAKTIGNVIVILKEMFKHAVQWGYLDASPVRYVQRPRGEDKERDVLTPEEVRRLLEAQEEPLRTLLLTAVLTGMRQGELLGPLRPSHAPAAPGGGARPDR